MSAKSARSPHEPPNRYGKSSYVAKQSVELPVYQLEERPVHFMIIERFRHADPVPVYRRFRDQGRMAPDGLRYVGSWVTEDLAVCYQVMECDDRTLLDAWMANWEDLVDFEVIPVRTSTEASGILAPVL